jgi:hypothetical protein
MYTYGLAVLTLCTLHCLVLQHLHTRCDNCNFMLLTMLRRVHGAHTDCTVMPALSTLHCKLCNIMNEHNNRWRSHLSSHRRLRIRNSLGVPVRISLKPSATAAATAAATASATAGAAADNTATNTGSTAAAVSALNAANSNSDVVSDVAPRGDVSVWIAGGSGEHSSQCQSCI